MSPPPSALMASAATAASALIRTYQQALALALRRNSSNVCWTWELRCCRSASVFLDWALTLPSPYDLFTFLLDVRAKCVKEPQILELSVKIGAKSFVLAPVQASKATEHQWKSPLTLYALFLFYFPLHAEQKFRPSLIVAGFRCRTDVDLKNPMISIHARAKKGRLLGEDLDYGDCEASLEGYAIPLLSLSRYCSLKIMRLWWTSTVPPASFLPIFIAHMENFL